MMATAGDPRRGRATAVAVFLLLVWGTFVFGAAVYPWAYWPLMVGAALVGVMSLARFGSSARVPRLFATALALIVLAILLQAVPLPLGARRWLSPEHAPLLSQLDLGMLVAPDAWRPLTIDRPRTLTAAACASGLFLLTLGVAKWLSAYDPRRFVSGLAVVGLVLAIVGIIQRPLFGTEIYGVWTPLMLRRPYEPFGPFVLENHFGGWMLLALPLVLSLLCARVAHGMVAVRPHWHARLMWLGSAEAHRLWFLALAAMIMSLSLLLTFSRSAHGAFVLALALIGVFAFRGVVDRTRRAAALGLVAFIGVATAAWVGIGRIVTFVRDAPWESLNVRLGPWADAWTVIQDFWLVGTGMNTYRRAMIVYQRFGADWGHYSQAHNDYLQILAEGGLLVAVPTTLALVALALEIRRRFRQTERGSTTWWLRVGAVTSLLAIALQETVEFSLQIPGNTVLFALIMAVAIHKPPAHRVRMSVDTRGANEPRTIERGEDASESASESTSERATESDRVEETPEHPPGVRAGDGWYGGAGLVHRAALVDPAGVVRARPSRAPGGSATRAVEILHARRDRPFRVAGRDRPSLRPAVSRRVARRGRAD